MPIVLEEKIGGAILRIEARSGGYRGALIRKGQPVAPEEDNDLQTLRARLRDQAGKLHPDYLGMDGALARFLHFFPRGFEDPAWGNERTYKLAARAKLLNDLPLEQAVEAGSADALSAKRAFAGTNLLSPYEKMTVKAVLDSAQGADFVCAAARFATGDVANGLAGMTAAVKPHGRTSWPIYTYLPFLWASDTHMFLKPTVTTDYAARVGHRFQFDYRADPDEAVYTSLLDLAATTERIIGPLGARDRIDTQSFIWVVGAYTDADLPHLERVRTAASA